jgi:hypothetical protein
MLLAIGLPFYLPTPASARGMGHDFFLLSPDGKLVRQLGSRYSNETILDWVDGASELVFHWDGKKLSGSTFAGKHVWDYVPPGPLDLHTNFSSSGGVLSFQRYGGNWWVGLDLKTGKVLFNIDKLNRAQPDKSDPAIDYASDNREFRYFLTATARQDASAW